MLYPNDKPEWRGRRSFRHRFLSWAPLGAEVHPSRYSWQTWHQWRCVVDLEVNWTRFCLRIYGYGRGAQERVEIRDERLHTCHLVSSTRRAALWFEEIGGCKEIGSKIAFGFSFSSSMGMQIPRSEQGSRGSMYLVVCSIMQLSWAEWLIGIRGTRNEKKLKDWPWGNYSGMHQSNPRFPNICQWKSLTRH